MIPQIEKIKEVKEESTIVYIINEKDDFKEIKLKKEEEKYVKEQLEKQKYAELNLFNKWLFFYIPPSNDEEYKELEKLRRKSFEINSILEKNKIETLSIINKTNNPNFSIACVEGIILSNYKFDKYKTKEEKKTKLKNVYILDETIKTVDLVYLKYLLEGVYIARDLINEPSNVLNTVYFCDYVFELFKGEHIKVNIYDKTAITKMKMGGLLAVNKGSVDPPAFIEIIYKPNHVLQQNPTILVGKGITFDTGGINLKSSEHIVGMKSDMSGGAAVVGTIYSLWKSNIPIYAIGLIPTTDNRPGFNAQVPGEIITMMSGLTVEMLNSDAEGRLILADALHYAKKYNPQLVIDIATLTGSASAAVGKNAIVAFSTAEDKVFKLLEEVSFYTYERIVKFPLWDDYNDMIKSEIADIKNIGGKYAGAITAAKFLQHFVEYPWIHLDIAGPAFLDQRDSYRGIEGTGVGVRLLFNFLKELLNL
ncbi:MAG: leucyl aminopeptidase family protein [Bacteroidales bacterium]|nr:leucyl aminopeptidase family protein [Bacteroidales bacterium]